MKLRITNQEWIFTYSKKWKTKKYEWFCLFRVEGYNSYYYTKRDPRYTYPSGFVEFLQKRKIPPRLTTVFQQLVIEQTLSDSDAYLSIVFSPSGKHYQVVEGRFRP